MDVRQSEFPRGVLGNELFVNRVFKASFQVRANMLYCGSRVTILGHFVHQQLKRSQRDFAGGVLAEDGKHVLVEQVLHVLSHLLAPGARLYGRERLPKLTKTLDGFSLVDELACVLLDVFRELLLGLVLRLVAGPKRLFLLSANGPAGGIRHIEVEKADPDLAF